MNTREGLEKCLKHSLCYCIVVKVDVFRVRELDFSRHFKGRFMVVNMRHALGIHFPPVNRIYSCILEQITLNKYIKCNTDTLCSFTLCSLSTNPNASCRSSSCLILCLWAIGLVSWNTSKAEMEIYKG